MPDTHDRECHCLLCEGGAAQTWPDREQRNARLVREPGWGVTGVLGTTRPDWAYSIGLWHSYGSPEVCLLGIAQEPAMTIVNTVGALVRDGLVLDPDLRLSGVINGYDLALAPVHATWYGRLFGAAIDFYQHPPFPMVQLLWPDKSGRYPGDPDFLDGAHDVQPSLWLPVGEHPAGQWTKQPPEWNHPDLDPSQMVYTFRRIVSGEHSVDGVLHDRDGIWQFVNSESLDESELTTAHLAHLVETQDVEELLDLPKGWHAWRQPDGTWLREPAEQ